MMMMIMLFIVKGSFTILSKNELEYVIRII